MLKPQKVVWQWLLSSNAVTGPHDTDTRDGEFTPANACLILDLSIKHDLTTYENHERGKLEKTGS